MLDIVLFRTDQGGDPDRIRKSQKDRYADVGLVDKVIEIDTEWRKTRGDLDDAKKAKGITQKGITEAMKKKETPAPELLEAKKAHEEKIAALEEKEKTLLASRQETIGLIGNLLPEDGSVPVDDDEDNNAVVDTWGAFETEDWMLSHYDLTQMTGIANTARGAEVAGSRGYFLVGAGALLNQALISYAQHFLTKRGSTMLQTPFAMNKSLMGKVAQLSDYDETLYKVARSAIPDRRNFSARNSVRNSPTASVHRLSGDGRRRGPVPDRHFGAADLCIPRRRVAGAEGAADPLRRLLDVLPEGGGVARPRPAGHLPRSPVREGRAVRADEPRGRHFVEDAGGDDRELEGGDAPPLPLPPLPYLPTTSTSTSTSPPRPPPRSSTSPSASRTASSTL